MIKSNRRRQSGFSMIELLVAVLVMGIGVLGITGLQMVSLQNNRGALLRSEAVMLAYDMLDRIRSNGTLAGAIPGLAYDGLAVGTAPPSPINCNANNCTVAQMVTFDQAVWKCALGNFHEDATCTTFHGNGVLPGPDAQPGLPRGDGSIGVDGANGIVTITVQWQDPNLGQRQIVIDSQG